MAETTNPEIFSKEIADLEAKLAAKKQEFLGAGIESPEKAVFKQVVREQGAPSEAPKVAIPSTATPAQGSSSRKPTAQEEQRLNLLVAHAFTKGLSAAIAEARKTGDAFFVDMLHDRLADEYYAKLLASRTVKPS